MSNSPVMTTVPRSWVGRIFKSDSGLRAGWALAIWIVIYAALTLGAQFSFGKVAILREWAARQPHGVISPVSQIAFTGLELVILLIAVVVTSKVEGRSLQSYGLSAAGGRGARFLQGGALGFGMGSVVMGLMALLGGYAIGGLALDAAGILSNGILYGIGFILVGVFEEFAFRGFLQTTLQRGFGVWPAAVILSLGFGAIHLPNAGGVWIMAVVAACFGLLAVFSVQRTGSLWFIFGAHAAFDWSIAFFYSAPIAGQPAQGHLLQTSLHGANWLTGGNAGPVGSVLTFAAFAQAGLIIHFAFPRRATASASA